MLWKIKISNPQLTPPAAEPPSLTSANTFSWVSRTSRSLLSAGTLHAPQLLPPTGFWASEAVFSKRHCHHGNRFCLTVGMQRPGCSDPGRAGVPWMLRPWQGRGWWHCQLLTTAVLLPLSKAVPIKSLASLSIFAGCSNELPVMKKRKGERNYSYFLPRRCDSVQGRFHKDPLEGCTLQTFVVLSYTL